MCSGEAGKAACDMTPTPKAFVKFGHGAVLFALRMLRYLQTFVLGFPFYFSYDCVLFLSFSQLTLGFPCLVVTQALALPVLVWLSSITSSEKLHIHTTFSWTAKYTTNQRTKGKETNEQRNQRTNKPTNK